MSGLLATSLSGLMASQRSLETVSHNIANANTDGYSRQRVELGTKAAQYTGDGYIGQGVNVANVTRSYDQFITKQLNSSLSAFGEADRYHQLATQVDNLMADPSTGMAPVMSNFFNSLSALSADPSSIPARQVLLSDANALAQNFNAISSQFESLRSQNTNDIQAKVNDINSLAKSLANINVKIVSDAGQGQGVQQPNDLLDQRDVMLSKLSELVNISVVPQQDGSASVFIGNGQPLVLNAKATEFTVFQSQLAPGQPAIGIKVGNGMTDISGQISGGSLAGSLRFQQEVLDPAQQQLGQVAAGLAMEFNAVHKNGFDLNGAAGQDLFSFSGAAIPVINNSLNKGNATVTAAFQSLNINPSAAGSLDSSDYRLEYVNAGGGVDYTLTRLRDDQVMNLTATDTVPATGNFSLSFAAKQPAKFDATAFGMTTVITPGAFTPAVSSGSAAIPGEETIGAFTNPISAGADLFSMDIDGNAFFSKAGSVGGTVTGAELDTAMTAFLAVPANNAAYQIVSGSFATNDLRLRKLDGTAIVPNITSNFTGTPGAFAGNGVNVAGSPAVAPTGGPFTLEVDGLQIYSEAATAGGTVTKGELDAALNTFLTTGPGAGVYAKTGSFENNDLILSKSGMTSSLTISSNFSGAGSVAGAFAGSTVGVLANPTGTDIKVDLSGGKTIAVGDQFVTRPTYNAAQEIRVNIDDPRKIAAATNIAIDPVTKLTSVIKGPMPGDNRNALQLANLQNKLGMLGGNASFSGAYGQIVSNVGALTRSAELSSSAQETLLNQAKGAQASLAGVNLDEEAANLIKFQQAYQASAQSISIARSLFDTLIGAVR